jgi:alpha-beta hydrolase superfamily lysophospholipase
MESLITGDGIKLHLRRWPAPPPVHGTVQIVHGLGEHIGRYAELAAELNAAGWNVAGHDQRGHGRSEGPRGSIVGDYTLLVDLAAVTDHVRGSGRHVMLGHSMGGLIAARFAAESLMNSASRWARDIDGLVLSSPALDLGLNPVNRLLLKVLSRIAPGLRLGNGLRASWLSHDPQVVKDYLADRLVHRRVTPQLVRFMVQAGELVRRRAARWRTPTLLLWAGADRCVAARGSAEFAAAAPRAVVVAHEYPDLYHEIFNEPDRAAVVAQLLGWLRRFELKSSFKETGT